MHAVGHIEPRRVKRVELVDVAAVLHNARPMSDVEIARYPVDQHGARDSTTLSMLHIFHHELELGAGFTLSCVAQQSLCHTPAATTVGILQLVTCIAALFDWCFSSKARATSR